MIDKLLNPIGVFDSGLGGLTVLKELLIALPDEQIIYLGDTARVPYGNKSVQTVTRYSFEITRFLIKKGIKLLIIACNTASAYSIESIRNKFPVPCLGVIQPGAKAATKKTISGSIGVIGTKGTIQSHAYSETIYRITPDLKVFERACPLFVPLVEEGWIDNEVTEIIANKYLSPLLDKYIDVLILGCTHYPLLKGVISRIMGTDIMLVDSAEETASETLETLKNLDLLAPKGAQGGCQIYITDITEQFSNISTLFLGENCFPVSQITLDEMV